MRAALLLCATLAGCAGHDRLQVVDTRDGSVGFRGLGARPAGAGVGSVQAYTLQAGEGFRMPRLHHAPEPEWDAAETRQHLPPTTICLHLVLDAQGQVERSWPLLDREECSAGGLPENQGLAEAARQAVTQWRFVPAALCRYEAAAPPDDAGCTKAASVDPVPVSLLYAFTFEIVAGQRLVRSQGR